MCGIFGFSLGRGLNSNEIDNVKKDVRSFVNLSILRGSDTFGININSDNYNYVFKSNLNPKIAIIKKSYKNFINKKLNLSTQNKSFFNYFGQTRLVTNGTKFLYKNNQPITTNRIAGLHNGILFHKKNLEIINSEKTQNYESFKAKSDSLDFFEKLDFKIKNENLPSENCFLNLIREFEGNFSISFNDLKESKLIISSNCGSLYYHYDKNEKIFCYASEKAILKKFLNKCNFIKNGHSSIFISQIINKTIILNYKNHEIEELNNFENINNNNKKNININNKFYKDFETVTNEKESLDKLKNLVKCTKCILPETYPFIYFDKDGVCNYCKDYKKQIFLGEDKLEEFFRKFRNENKKPDCLIGLSGGRDSCYGLHIIKTKYKMSPIAYTYDWGLTTDISRLNASKICGKLGVEHIIRSADIEKKRKYVRQNILAWLKDPHLGMLPIVQAGDKGFMDYGRSLCKELGVKFCVHATGYQLEQREFFLGFAGINQKLKNNQRMSSYSLVTKLKMFLWYSYRTLKNPAYINEALYDNFKGYVSSFLIKENFLHLFKYIKWDEEKMSKTLIDEYGWISDKSYGFNQWRMGDGQTAFNNFVYYQIAGFSEFDNFRSNQIREGLIDRKTALKLAEQDNLPRYDTLKNFSEIIGFNLDNVLSKVISIEKIY